MPDLWQESLQVWETWSSFQKVCRSRQQVNLTAHIDKDEKNELPSEDEGVCYPDGGEEYDGCPYVIRKLMLAPKVEDKSQHYNLEQTRCTLNNIFYLIVDSGRCDNIYF